MAFLAAGFSIYLGQFVHLSPALQTAVSLTLVIVLSAANYIGVKEGAWIQRIFTTLKIAGILLLIGAAMFTSRAGGGAPPAPAKHLSYSAIGLAMTAILMAYNGWSYVSFVSGEVKNPQRNLPLALAVGMIAVIVFYVTVNIAYFKVMTVAEIAATERVGAAVAAHMLGPAGANGLSVVVLLSIIGALNGNILTGARIPFAEARDGLFFSRFGRIHPRFETPGFAIVALGAWTCILLLTGSYQEIFAYSILSAWLFYTLSVVAVAVLRRKAPNAPRPYRMWGYPYTIWAFVVVSIWFMVDALINQPKTSLAAFGIAAAGIPLYFIWRKKPGNREPVTLAVEHPEI
jgi:APA family basic amino acid/polyamine antiporter